MRKIHLISYVLMAAGAVLLFEGARIYLESRIGQQEASRRFEQQFHAPNSRSQRPGREFPQIAPEEGEPIAKLLIPRLDTELYVVEGDNAQDLRRGPGHLPGTAMPGADGNCIIAGHRDTHFRILKDIKPGDDIILQTSRGQFLYRVERTSIVQPTNTSVLRPTSDAELSLITCYPFYYVGSAPKRFVVEAQLAGSVGGPS